MLLLFAPVQTLKFGNRMAITRISNACTGTKIKSPKSRILKNDGYIPIVLQNARLMLLLFAPVQTLKFGNRMAITRISKPAREQKSNRLNLAF